MSDEKRIYAINSLEDPLWKTNKVQPDNPGCVYVWDDNPYNLEVDNDLFHWFRGVPNERITVADIIHSQDKRYAQPLMYFLARSIHAKNIVEIGVADGSTTWPLLKAASECDGTVYSVDVEPCHMAQLMVARCHLWDYWYFSRNGSNHFFEEDKGKDLKIDFAFIDGDHSYLGVYDDTKNVLDRLLPGGIVMWDEYSIHWSPEEDSNKMRDRSDESASGGTGRALCDLLPSYPDIDLFPLHWGICGYDRHKEWTETTMLMGRKRTGSNECVAQLQQRIIK